MSLLRPHFAPALVALALAAAPAVAQPRWALPVADPPSVVARPTGPGAPLRYARDGWWGVDKAQHFTASAALALSAQYVLTHTLGAGQGAAAPVAFGLAAGAGLAKESYDARRPHGTGFSPRDLVWDALGLGAAAVLVAL